MMTFRHIRSGTYNFSFKENIFSCAWARRYPAKISYHKFKIFKHLQNLLLTAFTVKLNLCDYFWWNHKIYWYLSNEKISDSKKYTFTRKFESIYPKRIFLLLSVSPDNVSYGERLWHWWWCFCKLAAHAFWSFRGLLCAYQSFWLRWKCAGLTARIRYNRSNVPQRVQRVPFSYYHIHHIPTTTLLNKLSLPNNCCF